MLVMYLVKFRAYGHHNVKATHPSTLEITTENYLTERGDCIVAVKSEMSCRSLPTQVKEAIRNDKSIVEIELKCGDLIDKITARGSRNLTLSSDVSIVIRKSDYIDGRTLCIKADKAASDLSRKLIALLKNPNTMLEILIKVYST